VEGSAEDSVGPSSWVGIMKIGMRLVPSILISAMWVSMIASSPQSALELAVLGPAEVRLFK